MGREDDRLFDLEEALLAIFDESGGMLLPTLDGFVAGLILGPEPVTQAEWLPVVFGDAAELPALGRDRTETTVAAILGHFNEVARDLRLGRYDPHFDVDVLNDDILWEPWIDGFVAAMDLRPEAWTRLIAVGDGPAMAASALALLAEAADSASGDGLGDLSDEEVQRLCDEAPELIPHCVATLHDRFGRAGPAATATPKVGRNDPCPCGSGRKFKKCCGA